MLIVLALVLLVWLVQLLLVLRIRAALPTLDAVAPAAPASDIPARYPRITMVVPARDEARHIEAAVASKLACGYPELEIVCVDDRSRDATGAILDRLAASDPRVTVVHLDSLPEGWLGKLNAMARGLERSTGEWVLFSDADVHVEPGVLERLVAWAGRERVDFVAVFPRMRPVNPWIDAGLAVMLRTLSIGGRAWAANDDTSKIGMGVGAFNLARRETLERTRAVENLRMEVADDVALGAMLKQCGARTRFLMGRDAVHLEFQESVSAFARSMDKGGGMLGFSWWKPLLAAVVPLVGDLVVPLWGIASGGAAAALGAAILLVATAAHVLIIAHFAGPVVGAFFWPIGDVLMSGLMLRAGLKAWRAQGITWRDTFYPRAVVEAGQRLKPVSFRVDLR